MTQMVQGGIIMGLGDFVAQTAIEKKTAFKQYEPIRTVRFAVMGSFFVAPLIRGWYLTMERIVANAMPKAIAASNAKSALVKVLMDQGAFAPFFSLYFLSTLGMLSGHSMDIIKANISRDFKDILLTGWSIWPAAQMINFYIVPFNLRPLVVSFVALFWNTYLAWKTSRL